MPWALTMARQMSYSTHVLLLIFTLFIVRLIAAAFIEIGNDEAYYWFYTQHLQWNYFDHPPMVALLGRIFTLNLSLQGQEVFVRLGSIATCALSTWFLYRAVALLHSDRAGWYAAILYNASFYSGIVAGLLIMPDSPQMLFWTFCLWMMARILVDDQKWINWILFGLSAGLCIMSKIHGVFIWSGLGLYTLFQKREWLLRPQFYLALLLTILIASPILLWNLQNDFATYRFHSKRVTINGRGFQQQFFINEVLGQFFFNNPANVVLMALALIKGRVILKSQPALRLFLFTGLPLAGILLFIASFRHTFPHWSGPAYISLIPMSAIYLATASKAMLYPAWIRRSLTGFFIFLIGWPLVTQFYPGTWGSQNQTDLGKGDVTLDRFGWKEAGDAFTAFYQQQVNSRAAAPNTPLVCNTWWGAHTEYYFGRPGGIPMIALGSITQIHHYAWINSLRKEKVNMEQAFCVVPSDEYYDVAKHFAPYYHHIELVRTIATERSGKVVRKFYVYRLEGWKNSLPQVQQTTGTDLGRQERLRILESGAQVRTNWNIRFH